MEAHTKVSNTSTPILKTESFNFIPPLEKEEDFFQSHDLVVDPMTPTDVPAFSSERVWQTVIILGSLGCGIVLILVVIYFPLKMCYQKGLEHFHSEDERLRTERSSFYSGVALSPDEMFGPKQCQNNNPKQGKSLQNLKDNLL